MTQIQYIERDGHREFAVVPIELWDRIKTWTTKPCSTKRPPQTTVSAFLPPL